MRKARAITAFLTGFETVINIKYLIAKRLLIFLKSGREIPRANPWPLGTMSWEKFWAGPAEIRALHLASHFQPDIYNLDYNL